MSLDDPTPTEYFGPHAKRWTNPDTGVTISLSPRDYYRAVAKQQLREEKEREERYERRRQEAVSAAWNDEALYDRTTAETMNAEQLTAETMKPGWPNVISMDPGGPAVSTVDATLFKNRGVLIPDGDGLRKINEAEARTLAEAYPEQGPQMISANPGIGGAVVNAGRRYRLTASTDEGDQALLARGETRYLTGAKIHAGDLEISADGIKPLTVEGANLLERGRVRYLSMVEDDTFGSIIRPVEQTAPGKTARHLKRRRSTRNTLRLALLYIIAVIGVAAVVGVML